MKILLVSICLVLQFIWSSPVLATDFKIATWNIAHLNDSNGEGEKERSDKDFQKLAVIASELDADIIALQEVENAQAVKRVFGSDYRFEISNRRIPNNRFQQRTGFAIRKGIKVTRNPDYQELATSSGLRFGTDITVELDNKILRLLSVHLKSGCFTQDLENPSSNSCQKLARQLPKLEAWIDARAREEIPYIVLGDFNRRINNKDDIWKELDDGIPVNADLERIPSEGVESSCWKFKKYIDFFLVSPQVAQWYSDEFVSIPIPKDAENYKETKLSDHCPIAISLNPKTEKEIPISKGIIIRSALVNAANPEKGKEWVILTNTGNQTVDVSGWSLEDKRQRREFIQGSLKAGEETKIFLNGGMRLVNSGGTITLLNSQEEIVNQVSYSRAAEGKVIVFE